MWVIDHRATSVWGDKDRWRYTASKPVNKFVVRNLNILFIQCTIDQDWSWFTSNICHHQVQVKSVWEALLLFCLVESRNKETLCSFFKSELKSRIHSIRVFTKASVTIVWVIEQKEREDWEHDRDGDAKLRQVEQSVLKSLQAEEKRAVVFIVVVLSAPDGFNCAFVAPGIGNPLGLL